jgi:BASS family bile acid:Na+ symporter
MSLAKLLPLAIQAALMLMVLSLGLKATFADLFYLFRRPGQLMRALLSMDVIVPLIAVLLASRFARDPPVKIALVTLALAPLPATFPKKALKAGCKVSYTVGLMAAITLVAIVFIPISLELISRTFGITVQMSVAAIWELVFVSLLVPLVTGVAIHHVAAAFADRVARPVSRVADIVLIVAVIPIAIKVLPAIWSLVGDGTVVVLLIFALLALASGHLLGGPDPEDRTVLALSSSFRHPGIALAIAHANFPDQTLAPAAVIMYVALSGIAAKPYLLWIGRRQRGDTSVMSVPNASA